MVDNITTRAFRGGRGRLLHSANSITRLQVAKTGGRMIDTEEQFAEIVLAKDVPRPVLVFFSAPW